MTEPTRRKTLPRYQRDRTAFPKFTLRERDREIVRLVFEHRFLDTELIWHLVKKDGDSAEACRTGRDGKARPVSYGFGRKALYKRLQALYHTGYLDRRFPADQPIGRGYDGPRAIYGIGPKSVAILSEVVEASPQEIRRVVESNKVGDPFMRHALEIARLRVILELACRGSQDKVRLIFWEQGPILQDWVYGLDEDDQEHEFSVYPDAFFGIEVKGRGKAQYFLELDRGTMPIAASGNRSDIRKKVFGYYYYRQAKQHSKRYRYRRLPDGAITGLHVKTNDATRHDFSDSILEPIKFFRVLFVAPGSSTVGRSAEGRLANIIGAFPSLGKRFASSQLFWFASPDEFSLERPETIFAHQWLTPNPEHGRKSIIE
jgi:hypothetical protein